MAVSTPEVTALDLVHFPKAAGYWNNIATVLIELSERIDPNQLVEAAKVKKLSDAQRLGYLLDLIEQDQIATPLANWLATKRTTVTALHPSKPTQGLIVNARWRLIPNEHVEPEL